MVNGSLQSAINAHGPINNINLSSASKRVAATINAELRRLFTDENLDELIIRLRQAEKKGGDAMRHAEQLEKEVEQLTQEQAEAMAAVGSWVVVAGRLQERAEQAEAKLTSRRSSGWGSTKDDVNPYHLGTMGRNG